MARRDKQKPPHPTEVIRYLFDESIKQLRNEQAVRISMPTGKEHAKNLVESKRPLQLTTMEVDAEFE